MCEIQLNGKRQCLQSSSSTHGGAVDFPHSYTSTYPISVALSDSVSTDLVAAVSSVDKQERREDSNSPASYQNESRACCHRVCCSDTNW